MIQRVQSVYLAIMMILLSFAVFSTNFFSFLNDTNKFSFGAYGIVNSDISSNKILSHQFFPIFIGMISLILLAFITLMYYKNIKRQFKLGRLVFVIYFLVLILLFVLSIWGNKLLSQPAETREMGIGFLLVVLGFPFSFLANVGIKRDKQLLDSLDRLR